jgi:hypothetical protein
MQSIVKVLWDIALRRSDPSHLPDSLTMLAIITAVYAAFGAIQSWMLYGGDRLLARTLADPALSLLLVWLLLLPVRRGHRFRQTASAVLGTGAVLSPPVILLMALGGPGSQNQALGLLVWAGSVGIIVWYTFIVGHILRAALDSGIFAAVALALAYVAASAIILDRLFPGGA